jgi:hypothetical protein
MQFPVKLFVYNIYKKSLIRHIPRQHQQMKKNLVTETLRRMQKILPHHNNHENRRSINSRAQYPYAACHRLS